MSADRQVIGQELRTALARLLAACLAKQQPGSSLAWWWLSEKQAGEAGVALQELAALAALGLVYRDGEDIVLTNAGVAGASALAGEPRWLARPGKLLVAERLVKCVLLRATVVRQLLNGLQAAAWPVTLRNPLREKKKDLRRLHDGVRTLSLGQVNRLLSFGVTESRKLSWCPRAECEPGHAADDAE